MTDLNDSDFEVTEQVLNSPHLRDILRDYINDQTGVVEFLLEIHQLKRQWRAYYAAKERAARAAG